MSDNETMFESDNEASDNETMSESDNEASDNETPKSERKQRKQRKPRSERKEDTWHVLEAEGTESGKIKLSYKDKKKIKKSKKKEKEAEKIIIEDEDIEEESTEQQIRRLNAHIQLLTEQNEFLSEGNFNLQKIVTKQKRGIQEIKKALKTGGGLATPVPEDVINLELELELEEEEKEQQTDEVKQIISQIQTLKLRVNSLSDQNLVLIRKKNADLQNDTSVGSMGKGRSKKSFYIQSAVLPPSVGKLDIPTQITAHNNEIKRLQKSLPYLVPVEKANIEMKITEHKSEIERLTKVLEEQKKQSLTRKRSKSTSSIFDALHQQDQSYQPGSNDMSGTRNQKGTQ